MATQQERLGIVEVKVENLNEKIDDLKVDIKDVHDCLDRTGETLKTQLNAMHQVSCQQHEQLAGKIRELEQIKRKYATYAMMGLAFVAGAGWIGNPSASVLLKFLGL